MCELFRCSLDELNELKRAYHEQMLQTFVNGCPVLHQCPEHVDCDGAIREKMWQAVADSNSFFNATLSGYGWGGYSWGNRAPYDFEGRVKDAKVRIFYDNIMICRTSEARTTKKRELSKSTSSGTLQRSRSLDALHVKDRSHSQGAQRCNSEVAQRTKTAEPQIGEPVGRAASDGITKDEIPESEVKNDASPTDSFDPLNRTSGPRVAIVDFLEQWKSYSESASPKTLGNYFMRHSQPPPANTPIIPSTDNESDNLDPSEASSDDVVSEASDPFWDSPASATSGAEDSVMRQINAHGSKSGTAPSASSAIEPSVGSSYYITSNAVCTHSAGNQ